jgi:regulator of protease activity HflC (stomatin/prohibitin superfamily)
MAARRLVGHQVIFVEIKDVKFSDTLQRAMAKQM